MTPFNIYLAGGMGKFGVKDFDKCNDWRIDVKKELEEFDGGDRYKVYCTNPNDFYSFLDSTTYDSQREVMNFDLNRLRDSNLVIVNFNDISSLGTMAEIAIAYENRIPIIGYCEDELALHPWQKCMIDKLFVDWCTLLNYVEKYYLQ